MNLAEVSIEFTPYLQLEKKHNFFFAMLEITKEFDGTIVWFLSMNQGGMYKKYGNSTF